MTKATGYNCLAKMILFVFFAMRRPLLYSQVCALCAFNLLIHINECCSDACEWHGRRDPFLATAHIYAVGWYRMPHMDVKRKTKTQNLEQNKMLTQTHEAAVVRR